MTDWVAPRTWVDAEFVTEDELNEQLRDNLNFLMVPNKDSVTMNEADKTTTSASYAAVDAGGDPDFSLTVETFGEDVIVHLHALISVVNSGANQCGVNFDFTVDGVAHAGDDGVAQFRHIEGTLTVLEYDYISFSRRVTGLAAGSHVFSLTWRVYAGAGTTTATIYLGGTGSGRAGHPQMWATKG